MILRIVDIETTDSADESDESSARPVGIVEFGFYNYQEWRPVAEGCSMLCQPDELISIGARAVHHISPVDLTGAPRAREALAEIFLGPVDVFVAHNADFERLFLAAGGPQVLDEHATSLPWICTYKCALRLWPEAERHTNQFLRYFLNIDETADFDPELALPPHRALPDAYVTAHILRAILETGTPVETLIAWSNQPPMPERINFGKHKGQKWAELPWDYLNWIVQKSDMDKNTKWLAKHHQQ